MSREDYASSFVKSVLGLPSNFDIHLTDSNAGKIADHLSGRLSPKADLGAPVNDILKSSRSEIVNEHLASGEPVVKKALWPEGAEFAVALTHDVDRLTAPLRHVLKVRSRFPTSLLIKRMLLLEDPYWNIEKMVRLEAELGLTSSFYLLVHEYRLLDKRRYIRSIVDKGWDIGLHGSFGTHESLERMREDLEIFVKEVGKKPAGIREHYLKFDPMRSWSIMDELGFVYDTTWGFNQKLGFRAGVSFPYHPPSPEFEPMKILELPLVLMDTSLWGYMHLQEEEGYFLVEKVLSKVREENGLFTLLWHQEALQMRGGRLYGRILKRILEEKCFVSNAAAIAQWWLNRENSILTEQKDGKSSIYSVWPKDGRLVLEAEFSRGHKLKLDGDCRVISSTETNARIAANGACIIKIEGA